MFIVVILNFSQYNFVRKKKNMPSSIMMLFLLHLFIFYEIIPPAGRHSHTI